MCFACESRVACFCIRVCVGVCGSVCECVSLSERASAWSWRCRDGVQVFHQALEVRHLLGQLVGLVALRERNRVTAGGRGGTGGQGGKHLGVGEGREERRRGKEGEEVSQGIHQRPTGRSGMGGW